MKARIRIKELESAAYEGLYKLENYLQTSALLGEHFELIKIRASQINGCAFCINMHTEDARKNGESEQRIYMLNAWRETKLFTEEEKTILALTEEVTLISNGGLSDETYQKAETLFGPNYLALLIMAVVAINAWNRVAISTGMDFDG
ncbi:carboxymuconolactone decarboxylase family protein [Mariniphaga sediminis]|uniref:Carboxymuconolactone decarboxylase family protein n=1 Tax=Mariniphaga sediminis TaxID=1628158 RepID=A0A399D5Q0_9BACT|nr:carboxymuconolactone decarboxylase family protein [Mariniphaga sediminis]RIH64310.1 carboxymuconolactone decarboxylase family protein [Mariniphaga sediminis]RIH66826.1 carboxymuconolactone decarboxylase family protein [Mariniphaga sediminis]